MWELAWPQGKFMDDRIFKNLLQTKLDFENSKIHDIFCLFLFYNVYKENMFTIEIEDSAKKSLVIPNLAKILFLEEEENVWEEWVVSEM